MFGYKKFSLECEVAVAESEGSALAGGVGLTVSSKVIIIMFCTFITKALEKKKLRFGFLFLVLKVIITYS